MRMVVRGGGDGWRGDRSDEGGGGRWWRRVAARDMVERIDQVMRNVFELGRKTRRKSFPVAGGGGGRNPAGGGRRKN
ncbi:hypothetical protein Tco_0620629 [Tanacetum coccineum]